MCSIYVSIEWILLRPTSHRKNCVADTYRKKIFYDQIRSNNRHCLRSRIILWNPRLMCLQLRSRRFCVPIRGREWVIGRMDKTNNSMDYSCGKINYVAMIRNKLFLWSFLYPFLCVCGGIFSRLSLYCTTGRAVIVWQCVCSPLGRIVNVC